MSARTRKYKRLRIWASDEDVAGDNRYDKLETVNRKLQNPIFIAISKPC